MITCRAKWLLAGLVCIALSAACAPQDARRGDVLGAIRAKPAIPAPGSSFGDCSECPEMVVIPPGSFRMGELHGSVYVWEKPVHAVHIGYSFAVGKFEVTFAEWAACVSGGGCEGYRLEDLGWGRGRRPAINVSWEDAKAYVKWLSRETGKTYRLLSEAEWEYAARGGTETRYPWGNSIGSGNANCDGCGSQWDDQLTAPAGSFSPNSFGLHDMHGNVFEWVEDCWHGNYDGAPTDGSAWTSSGPCGVRVLRGGSWDDVPLILRSAHREGNGIDDRYNFFAGFRVARTLP